MERIDINWNLKKSPKEINIKVSPPWKNLFGIFSITLQEHFSGRSRPSDKRGKGGQSFRPWDKGGWPPGPSPGSATAFCVWVKALSNDFSTELFWKKEYPCDITPLGVARENRWHFVTTPTVFLRNDIWETSTEIAYWWHVTTQIWVVLLIGWSKFHQSSVWNFCTRFLDVILRGNQWWRRKISCVFSGYFRRFQ